ncbi:ABC transporter substrate-binding protein [Nocardioides sp. zg-536]|uniref:ABC transporter substrate-binding protein n=1 Tax=Nocardioides faecalis TaxID=2803858 RepID=A0A938Y2V8_9ACTN|nr:ABC transporter substrate-binding protein [Nocardioides faecalis]MBM9461177.1 ABC transporter substrate-binding protein [Nocardioides faecalis]QVI59026.1 ABC transporter substrate-binding protein [Nocardioides faecalis]
MIKNRVGSRRLVAAAAVLTMTALGLSACGSDDNDASGDGGPVRALLYAQPTTLDPVVGARTAASVWSTMLEPLIDADDDLELVDTGIITSWERTDPTTWTFKVREGIEFTNGEKADAAAVANSILLNRDTDAAILKSYFANVKTVEAPDATTVVVTTEKPQYNLADLLSNVFLVPAKYYEEKGSEGFAAAPVGTGPYVLDEVAAGRSISVKVNPDYWGEEPENEGVEFTWSNEPSQRLALLQSESVDIALDLPQAQAEQAEKAGLKTTTVDTAMKIIAFLESNKAPFDDPQLREAAALAIDREAIAEGIFDGNVIPDGGLLNIKPGSEPAEQVDADPAKAKSLVKGSPEVPITYPAGQYVNIDEVAQAIGGSLEAAGFKVKYNPVDYGTLVKQIVGRQLNGIYFFAGVPNVAVPDFFASGFMKSVSITGNCPDPKMDELVASALEQDDAAAAAPIYEELNTLGVVEKHCYVPLYRMQHTYATQKDVSGMGFNALSAMDFTKVKS